MKVKITYPKVKRKRMEYKKLINIIFCCILALSLICSTALPTYLTAFAADETPIEEDLLYEEEEEKE